MLFKNKMLFVLFLIYSFNISMLAVNLEDYSDIIPNKSEIAYYKNNKLDFFDKKFQKDVLFLKKFIRTDFDKLLGLFYLLPFVLPLFSLDKNNSFDENIESYFFTMIPVGIWTAIYTMLMFKAGDSTRSNIALIKVLEKFLDNYFIDKQDAFEVNYRDLIPEEFIPIFDEIYKSYQLNGLKELDKFINVINLIRNKVNSKKLKIELKVKKINVECRKNWM